MPVSKKLSLVFGTRLILFAWFILINSQPLCAQDPSSGQQREPSENPLVRWIQLDAPPGWEHLATDLLTTVLPGWSRDSAGNLTLRKGSGSPRRVVACALDRAGFAVTEITEDGYLRVRETGSIRRHPLFAQFHEGQRIRVLTRSGSVDGVLAVRSTHLQRGRTAAEVTTLEDLWVDVGARSRLEVERLGIQLLDPIVRDLPAWSFSNFVAGPSAGARVGCAAVATAAQAEVTRGQTTFLLTTLRSFGNDGLEAALRKLGPIDELYLIDEVAGIGSQSEGGVVKLTVQSPSFLPETAGITSAVTLAPEVRFPGSLVETVDVGDATALLSAVARVAGIDFSDKKPRLDWISPPAATRKRISQPADALTPMATLLASLSDLPAVSGHEDAIRGAILAALPVALRSLARTDGDGNVILELGPDRDAVMFIAHQDEVGFEVANIATDGVVLLRARGGLYGSLWEGQPALLHFDRTTAGARPPGALRGIFIPRATATTKQPEAMLAWFGFDGAELARRGVRVGQSVTAYKRATRLASTRFTARALDDRSGTTALILAARQINPATLRRRVILAWSVREETGLEGARVLAKHYASSLTKVYSVDTFVSSDSPLESTRFAYTPLGKGAVIRGLDNASVSTANEIDRISSIARRRGIALQVGATNGGADGSEFVRYGVTHAGLSWPGRYSHSPVEVLDLRDLESLERLIVALATGP